MEDIKKIVEECDLKHIAIIMDGNRRWAKERNLPSMVGHKKGVEALKATMRAFDDFGIKYLTVYAFSTENWNRKPEEVNFLMDLLAQTLKNELNEMNENNVVISFIGDTTKLSNKLQKILANAVETTKNNTGVNLQIAFNYGARDELVHAVQSIVDEGITDITENTISSHLYTKEIPDPDLLIRTGGGLVCGILNIIIGICLITAPPEILISYFSFLFAANLLLLGIEQIVLVRRLNYFGVGNFAWVIVNGILNIVSAILFLTMPITSVAAASIIVAIYIIIGGVTLFIESINAKNLKINNEE